MEQDLKEKVQKQEDKGEIAIASSGKDETSEISPTAGRAPSFLIYKDKKLEKAIKNSFAIWGSRIWSCKSVGK